ncbi:Alpha/beta hydrolase family protein [compost metagenome]
MKQLTEPERRVRFKAALPTDPRLAGQWRTLQERAKPVFTPAALATALTLGGSLLVSGFLQFVTGVYETNPGLSQANAVLNAGLAVAVGIMVGLRRPWDRPHYAVMVGMGAVLALSLGSLGAKIQYQRGLAGNPFYALPHYAVPYPQGAQEVSLQATDGVRVAGTYLAGGHRKAVVIVPPWRANRDAFSISTLAQWLANTYDVLVIDPRGQGDSAGAQTPDGAAKHDVVAAVSYLKATGHDKIAVLAEQDGAYAAILAGAMRPGIDSLALVAPGALWGESLGQSGRAWDPSTLKGRLYWRVVAGLRLAGATPGPTTAEAIGQVAPTPVLLLGNKTEIGSTVDQLHLSAGEPKSLMVLGGQGRPASWSHFAEYYSAVKEWFDFSLSTAVERAAK